MIRRFVLEFCFVIALSQSVLSQQVTITIPTGPFCDDCVITNLTFYDIASVDAWRIDAESRVHAVLDDIAYARRTLANDVLGGQHYNDGLRYEINRLDNIIQDYIIEGDYTGGALQALNILHDNLEEIADQCIYLDGELSVIQTNLYALSDYLVDDITDYRAQFATACLSPGTNGMVCCDCPDYTPYLLTIISHLDTIDRHVASLWVSFRDNIEHFFEGLQEEIDYEIGEDSPYAVAMIVSALAAAIFPQPYYYENYLRAYLGSPSEYYYSFMNSLRMMSSNFVAGIHYAPSLFSPSVMGPSLFDNWSTYQSDNTLDVLQQFPMLDRIVLPLHDLDAFMHWGLVDDLKNDYKTIYGVSPAYWSLSSSMYGVMSNFWESVHDRSEGRMAPSLVHWHNQLVLTNSVAQLEKMPVLDRITLLLWRIARGGEDDLTNNYPEISESVLSNAPSDEVIGKVITYDTYDEQQALDRIDGIISGLQTLQSTLADPGVGFIRIPGFSLSTPAGDSFGTTTMTANVTSVDHYGSIGSITGFIRSVFVLAWTLAMAWAVYMFAVWYLLLFGRIVAVVWPLLHGDMVKASEAVHKVFDLTLFKAARFANFMGDFIEQDSLGR